MKRWFLFVLIVANLSACIKRQPPVTTGDTLATDGVQIDTTVITDTSSVHPVSIPKKTYRGMYITGNEVNIFKDCAASDQTYWVEDESGKLQSLYKSAKANLSYDYESVYAEVKGYLRGKSRIGYAEEYDQVLVVTEVVALKQKTPNTACYEYEFLVRGNEPFWAVEIIPSEKIIALKDVAAEKTYVFPYRAPEKQGTNFIYALKNDRNENLRIQINKEACSDGMSDLKYNYSATATINGKTLKGCAIKKGEPL
ncbi:COG3650 family protein [Pedobacter sp. SYSU D00535]|uniref:COG3650 family protein n=1 Tax=Pedobacter sp. SYSU D00535 TaxID=2810308 RepID=UPI001A96D313|nr:hypothetical protein [Pedobacter sp. SYSU D00535]